MTLGIMKSVLDVFTVPKVYDIRPVYNCTSSGLNEAVCAQLFGLHTVHSQLRGIRPGTIMGDVGVGEMFHNCVLEQEFQPYVGVNFEKFNFNL